MDSKLIDHLKIAKYHHDQSLLTSSDIVLLLQQEELNGNPTNALCYNIFPINKGTCKHLELGFDLTHIED